MLQDKFYFIYEYSLVIDPILAVDYLSLSLNSVNYFAVETVGARLQFSLGYDSFRITPSPCSHSLSDLN
jgi:hypothetical protein